MQLIRLGVICVQRARRASYVAVINCRYVYHTYSYVRRYRYIRCQPPVAPVWVMLVLVLGVSSSYQLAKAKDKKLLKYKQSSKYRKYVVYAGRATGRDLEFSSAPCWASCMHAHGIALITRTLFK